MGIGVSILQGLILLAFGYLKFYFLLYPYGTVYDKLLIGIKNVEYKNMSIKMIELAEKVIYKYDKVVL